MHRFATKGNLHGLLCGGFLYTIAKATFATKKTTPILGGVCILVLCMWMWFLIARYNMQKLSVYCLEWPKSNRFDIPSQTNTTCHPAGRQVKVLIGVA